MMRFHKKPSGQDGITLLLSVIMMSGIAIVTSTVAYFVIQEVRNTRTSRLSEPALIAAEAAGEQGIYDIKKNSSGLIQNCDSSGNSTAYTTYSGLNNVRIWSCVGSQPVVYEISDTTPLVFYLYDKDNVNGNLCMEVGATCGMDDGGYKASNPNPIYSNMYIEYLTGSSNNNAFKVEIDVETLDGISLTSTAGRTSFFPGETAQYTIPTNILNSDDERLKVSVSLSASGTASLKISTNGGTGGIPDYQTVNGEGCVGSSSAITSCNASTEVNKRRINITLPK